MHRRHHISSASGWLFLGLAALMTIGCIRRPEGVASGKKTAEVLADMQLAETSIQARTANDATREGLKAWILERHSMSRSEFDKTMDWYARNLDEYQELLKETDRQVLKRQKDFNPGSGEAYESGEGELWEYSRMILFSPLAEGDGFGFSMPVSGVQPGERVQWKMRFNKNIKATAVIGVEYEGGGKAYQYTSTRGRNRLDFKVQTDTALAVDGIFGYVMLDSRAELPVWADSISLRTLPLDTLEYYSIHAQRMAWPPKRRVSAGLSGTDTEHQEPPTQR